MAGNVPVVKSLADVYPEAAVSQQTDRWRRLLSRFRERYGRDADFVARSPGRVNIIGEHIDYSLFPVLPMAISADVLLAVSYDSSTSKDSQKGLPFRIKINNVQDEDFPGLEFELPSDTDVPIDVENHHWLVEGPAALGQHAIQEGQGRAVGQGHAVDLGQIDQTGAPSVEVDPRVVHIFGGDGAPAQVGHRFR